MRLISKITVSAVSMLSLAVPSATYAQASVDANRDYRLLTRENQAGDSRLQCDQLASMLGQMNDIVANGTRSPTGNSSGAAGRAIAQAGAAAVRTQARSFFSGVGGVLGGFGDAVGAMIDGAGETAAAPSSTDPDLEIRQAATLRRDRLLVLAEAKKCAIEPRGKSAAIAKRPTSQADMPTSPSFTQRNTYVSGQ